MDTHVGMKCSLYQGCFGDGMRDTGARNGEEKGSQRV